jgi:hypothetical protein
MLCDTAIIGAGPYALAAASYLRQIKGLSVAIHGEPMSTFRVCCIAISFPVPSNHAVAVPASLGSGS